eukprot:411771_1
MMLFVFTLFVNSIHSFISYSSVFIRIIYAITGCMLLMIVPLTVLGAMKRFDILKSVFAPLWIGTHFILSVVLMIVFLKKIHKLMNTKLEQMSDTEDKIALIEVNDIKSVTRYILLVNISIITTWISDIAQA